jgi:hypothetical protein
MRRVGERVVGAPSRCAGRQRTDGQRRGSMKFVGDSERFMMTAGCCNATKPNATHHGPKPMGGTCGLRSHVDALRWL